MSLEHQFRKSTCNYLRQILCEVRNQEQTMEIRLPDGMPDIGRVLGAWGQVILRSKEWRVDTVSFSGGIMTWVLYAPEDGTDPRCVESWIPFQMSWDIPAGSGEGKLHVFPILRFVDARSVSARKLMARAGVGAMARGLVSEDAQIPAAEELEEDIQLLKHSYPVRLRKEAGEKTFQLDEELSLPDSCPVAERLLRFNIRPEIVEQYITGKRFAFKGKGNLHLLYRSKDGQLCTWDFELPFSQLANLEENYGEDPRGEVSICVTSLELALEEAGRLRLKCSLVAQYCVSCIQLIHTVEDAYSAVREVTPQRDQISFPGILESRQESIFAEQAPPQDAVRIMDMEFLPDFPRQHRTGDQLELEIPGQFQLLYQREDGSLQSASPRWEGKYRMPIEEDAQTEIRVHSFGMDHPTANSGSLQLKPEIILDLKTWSDGSIPLLRGLETGTVKEPDPNRPSLILRRAGKDTLWCIAKGAGTTVAAIWEANGLAGEPAPEQMLLIPVP